MQVRALSARSKITEFVVFTAHHHGTPAVLSSDFFLRATIPEVSANILEDHGEPQKEYFGGNLNLIHCSIWWLLIGKYL